MSFFAVALRWSVRTLNWGGASELCDVTNARRTMAVDRHPLMALLRCVLVVAKPSLEKTGLSSTDVEAAEISEVRCHFDARFECRGAAIRVRYNQK